MNMSKCPCIYMLVTSTHQYIWGRVSQLDKMIVTGISWLTHASHYCHLYIHIHSHLWGSYMITPPSYSHLWAGKTGWHMLALLHTHTTMTHDDTTMIHQHLGRYRKWCNNRKPVSLCTQLRKHPPATTEVMISMYEHQPQMLNSKVPIHFLGCCYIHVYQQKIIGNYLHYNVPCKRKYINTQGFLIDIYRFSVLWPPP